MTKKIFFVLLFVGCQATKTGIDKKDYVSEFKLRYFKSCLRYGFNNTKQVNDLLAMDKSGYSEPMLGTDYLLIDSLTAKEAEKMHADSIKSIGRVAEGREGKAIIEICLCQYQSKWLDSIARQRVKKLLETK